MRFYLVDAFTDEPFRGNPAGVCIVDEYPRSLEMQRLAAYHNWSEISFVKHITGNRFYIRWFSPMDEAPLCGHATMAAAHILFSSGVTTDNSILFEYNSGMIGATLNDTGSITLSFSIKPIYKCDDVPFSIEHVIGIKQFIEIWKDELIYVIVLNSAADVIRATPNFDAIKKIDARAIAITGAGDADFDFSSRYFAPRVGIYEDPVCGSMHCRLAYYWKSVLSKSRFRAYQASRRTGTMDIEVNDDIVGITGKSVKICEMKPCQLSPTI
ncbi:MAG: PhzF family phenazine biosynthesis protein [Holosporales bacterium]|jgi:PhzF family phenazine biosynthesis protein|nr:PhzF family phenazine biosynthesis protein [Holosporales bacterium]